MRYSADFVPEQAFENAPDTLALYHVNEGSGTQLRDASGNGFHGAIHSATWVNERQSASKKPRQFALSFDGEDDYVELPLTYDFSHPVTFEAWVTVRDATGQPVIIQRKEAAGAALALKVNRQPAWELVSRTTSGTYVGLAETPKVQTGQLTHVAGVFDLKRLTLFVNGMKYSDLRIEGKPVTANDVVKYARSAAPILIGAGGGKVHALDGFIDEVRISRTARYTASFVPSRELQSDDDTLALYHFDEGQGTVLRDSSGNGHDGTIHGAAWIERNSPDASKSDFALSFDGVDDFVEVRSLQHEPGSPITIEATVSDWGDQFGFICGWRACAGLAAFRDTLAGALGTTDLKNDQDQKIQKKVSGPHKAQIALVYDGRQGRLFSNGRLLGTMKLEHPLKPSSNRWSKGFAIGAASERSPDGFIAPVKGVIDEVRVSNIARYDSSYEPTGRLHADEHTMALYHFDSGQGSVLRDSSGNGHDGTIHGATWVSNASSSSLQGDTQQVREALEWLVSTGGWCTVKRPSDDDAIHWNVTTKDEIPDEPFVVLAVGSHVRRPADGGPRFEPLHQLRGLNAFHTNSAVTPEDLEWLQSSPELEVLHVHSTSPLNDEWAVWLQQFSKLRRVTWNRFGDAGLNHLAKIDSLEEIGLNPPATASGIRHLASLPNLRSVDLQYGQVTPDLVAAVAELPAVRKLIISWRERSIEPATWTEIEKLTQLEALWLKNMKLNDSAVPHLQKLTNLRDLQIQNSGISKQGVEQLRQSLRLADIKSDHGVFESAATVNRRAAEWILKHDGNVIVRSLSTGGDKGVKAGETLPDSPFHLVQINLNKTAPEDEFANLAGLTELEGAFINYFPLTDAALAHLKDSTKLRSLHLEGTQITTEGLDILQNFPALESLQLPAGQTDAVVPKLLTAKRLKRLGVGFKSERVSSLSQLSELDQLESLRLLYVDVTADSSSPGSLQFLQQLPNLTSFGLARCKVSTQCLRKLAKLNRLRELSLRDNFVEPDTLKELGQFLHLDSLTVTGAGLTDASTGLFDNLTNLKLLHVLKNELSPEGIATLRKSLPGCRIESDHGTFEATAPKPYTPPTTDGYSDRKLAELAVKIGGLAEVQDNAAGTKSHVKPSEELPKQPFRLISIQFESAITPDQAGQIAELSGNLRPFKGSESKQRGLSRLTLSATEIDDSVIRRLSGLQTARLVVDQTNISDQALVTIGKFEILILLRLKGTSITDKGLVHLEGLKSLRDLDLSETRVTETGVTRLSQALPECQIQWNKRTFKAGN
ncbi:MAG: LamG-like jellyroll fold domain-containing protein [Planctomycetota bacterium]